MQTSLAKQIARNSLKAVGFKRALAARAITHDDLYIIDKRQSIIPLSPNRLQADLLGKLTGRDLVLKYRQGGVSTAIQAHLFTLATTRTIRAGTMAHDDETTQKLRDMQQLFYDQLDPALKPERSINNATRAYYPRTKSVVYIGTAGNAQRGRGGTYSHIHGSEVAFWKNSEQIMAGILQGVPTDGEIILESTPNGAGGWWYEQCMAALRGDSEWTLHFYPWWWQDEYALVYEGSGLTYTEDEQALADKHRLSAGQVLWRRQKQRELGRLFTQEYPEDPYSCFLTSGAGIFEVTDEQVYTPAKDAAPIEKHRYYAGLDWGQSDDYTALSIMDAADNREVFLGRWRRESWADIRAQVLNACEHWGVEKMCVEKNSASSNIENLVNEAYVRKLRMGFEPFTMTNKLKGEMVNYLRQALNEDGLVLIDNPAATAELRQFTTLQTTTGLWTYSHPTNGHDDTIIARMAAWRGCMSRIA